VTSPPGALTTQGAEPWIVVEPVVLELNFTV
jgi:hypothetical protein